jgi:hypothetical protein
MSRSSKIFMGILSFLPIVLLIIIIIMAFNMIPLFIAWDKHEPDFYTVFTTISSLLIASISTGLISLGLFIFFLIHMINHKKMEPVEKIIWIIAFIFAGIVSYPVYWYMRVWNQEM